MKLLHAGDLHLGSPYPDKAKASVDYLIAQIKDKASPAFDPDMVLITGDTTEHSLHVQSEHLAPLIDLINSVECPMVFLQGTPLHEPIGYLRNLESFTRFMITVLDRPEVFVTKISEFTCRSKSSDLPIAIASFPAVSKYSLEKWATDELGVKFDTPAANIQALFDVIAEKWRDFTGPKILMGHWTVSGCTTATGQTLLESDIAIGLDDLARTGADVVLLGHIHKSQEWNILPFLPNGATTGTKRQPTMVTFCGSSHPCNFGEMDQKSFSVLTFDNDGTHTLLRIPYPHKPMLKIEMTLTGEQNESGWAYVLDQQVPEDPAAYDIKLAYSLPRVIAPQFTDIDARLECGKLGFEPVVVSRTIFETTREEIADIASKDTTRSQYDATCHALGEDPRPGALEKADLVDSGVIS